MRGAWLMACVVALACGSGGGAAGDGGQEAPPAGSCDLLAQTGCAAGLKCDLACDLASGQTVMVCNAEGVRGVGEACHSLDDPCRRGAICAATASQSSACRKLCAGDGDCPTGTTCQIRPVSFCGTGVEVGTCL